MGRAGIKAPYGTSVRCTEAGPGSNWSCWDRDGNTLHGDDVDLKGMRQVSSKGPIKNKNIETDELSDNWVDLLDAKPGDGEIHCKVDEINGYYPISCWVEDTPE